MNSESRWLSRLGWATRTATALMLAGAAACGVQSGSELVAGPTPTASATVAEQEVATAAPASSTPERDTTASVSSASAPTTSVPSVSIPTTSVPSVSAPSASVPSVSVPTTSVPSVSVPSVSVPSASVPSVSLPLAPEYESGYDRDDWGPHRSGLCRGAVGTPDPYTGTPIDTCNVDHVVALHEAHESGGWAWPADAKQRFSQDPDNHVASRACVNQAKGGDDISEWSDADIASSSACGGGVHGYRSGAMLPGSDHGGCQVGAGPRRGPGRGERPRRDAGRMRRSGTRVFGRAPEHAAHNLTADHNCVDGHCCPTGRVCDREQDRSRI